jgi:hypothetical protein
MSLNVNSLRLIGDTISSYITIVLCISLPEFPRWSKRGLPRPPVTFPKTAEQEIHR